MMRKTRLSLPILGLLAAPFALRAQSAPPQKEPLKSQPPVVHMRLACSGTTAPAGSPTDDQRRDARDLAQRARQSAILGDAAAALDQLKGAAALDQTDPSLAYELARAYENAGSSPSAAGEYCRFLALAPSAPEAADVRTHVASLVPPKPDTVVTPEGNAFKSGAVAYDKGQWIESEAFFATVIKMDSTSADAFYNRAVVRLQQDRPEDAADDFERYLRIRPEAVDRTAVVERINFLRAARLSASEAFGIGIILPGGGQFYTRRPIRGMLSLIAVGASAGLALMPKTTSTSTTQTATDPFGNKYNYTLTTQQKNRPYFIPGLAAAGGIALISAIDAALYAHNVHQGSDLSVSLAPAPSGRGVGVFASIAVP
jgi:tetratricopeptide (TPR) repeat protein